MNTYDDNLHTAVVDSLNKQELEQKKINSKLTASMFTLYYAEAARITAAEKLELAENDLKTKASVKKQAVINNNIATNMLMSANQGKTCISQSITNAAVCAANVQTASNAIVKLSGDLGSIYSIVSASDYDTEIYEHTKEAHSLMNKTAYNAEKLSQHAMEASYMTAEVSANSVADKAKATTGSISELLKIAESEYNTVSQTVSDDNSKLASASTKEKTSEGALEDVNVEFGAINSVYSLMNKELNLDLKVPSNSIDSNGFTVIFHPLKSAFPSEHGKNEIAMGYPVKRYHLIIVKDDKKGVFSISEAENIMQKNPRHLIAINNDDLFVQTKSDAGKHMKEKIAKHINIHGKFDSDGDRIKRGENYVVFLLAQYDESYKRLINNFDDFLSAPSPTFCITYTLQAPDYKTFKFTQVEEKEELELKLIEENVSIQLTGHGEDDETQFELELKDKTVSKMKSVFEFQMDEQSNEGMELEYRCMFLPSDHEITQGLLTVNGLKTIENEVSRLQQISEYYDPKIAKATSEYNAARDKYDTQIRALDEANENISQLNDQIEQTSDVKVKDSLTTEVTKLTSSLQDKSHSVNSAKSPMDKAQTLLSKLKTEKKKAISKINMSENGQSGIFFNLIIAEQVPAGNYIKAKPPKASKAGDNPKKEEKSAKAGKTQTWHANVLADTTDNFGNPLIVGNSYVPVVLSYSTAGEEVADQFTNAISDYRFTKPFKFKGIKN